jgi:Rrf2 family cysteine metabolism transcriptional repressor
MEGTASAPDRDSRGPPLTPLRIGTRLNPDGKSRNSGASPRSHTIPVRTTFPSAGALHFSTRGEYGVRLMVELARHHGDGPVSLSEMADHEDLPRPYLEQLVVSLREQGLVISTRGARGGYQLARDPGDIRMSQVIQALEGPIAPMVCASEDPLHASACERSGYCNVNTLWVRVRTAVVSALDSMTLAELAQPSQSHPYHPPVNATALPVATRPATTEPIPTA